MWMRVFRSLFDVVARLAAFAKASASLASVWPRRSLGVGGTGRSSIPETAVLEREASGILDAPLSRSMTAEMTSRRRRGRRRGGLLHAVEAQHLLRGGGPQALIGFPAGVEVGRLAAGELVAQVDDR